MIEPLIPKPESRVPCPVKIIEAIGGRLDIRAVLPNGVVRINQFEAFRKAVRPDPVAGK